MKRREFIKRMGSGAALSAFAAAQTQTSSAQQPPNIIFIMVDDWGWSDAGCLGSDYYETPNIDRLAREGLRFTNAYANAPNCAPTRACLLSGQYPTRHGVYTVGDSDRRPPRLRKLIPTPNTRVLDPAITSFIEAMPLNYASCSLGKWHLGTDPEAGPKAQGFDLNVGGDSAGHPRRYFSPYKNRFIGDGPAGEYLTDRLTDEAIEFIQQHQSEPFFVYLPHYAVHTPIQARPEKIDQYQSKQNDRGHENPAYAAMIESVDEGLGRILNTLDELELAENTVVILTSDNGGHGCITDNRPLRGAKGMFYEGGIRIPLIVRWPGVIRPGSECHEPVISFDWYPTFLDMAGAPPPDDHVLDGVSLMPLLRGEASLDREALYWHFPAYLEGYSCMDEPWRAEPCSTIRKGEWKLIETFEPEGAPNRIELYNLKTDLSETTDLSKSRTEVVEDLLNDLKNWRERMNAPVPSEPNPLYDPGA